MAAYPHTFAIRENNTKQSFLNSAISLFVSIWIIFSLSHFVLLGNLDASLSANRALLIMLGFAIPLSDIFAYVLGKSFAKLGFLSNYKVASNLSPKKTYIGSLGNMMGAGIGISILFFSINQFLGWGHWVFLTILIGAGGLIGDITESMFKRYYKVKDSGKIIPGHGGVLDRIDSSTRIIVIVYYYLLTVVRLG